MKRRWKARLAAAGLLAGVAAAVLVIPLGASAHPETQLTIAVRYTLTSPTTATGTFSACCDIDDSGTTTASITITRVEDDVVFFECEHNFFGTLGSFHDVCKGEGTLHPAGSSRQLVMGHFEFVAGTGAYAGIKGHGKFELVLDGTNGTATGIHEGNTQP